MSAGFPLLLAAGDPVYVCFLLPIAAPELLVSRRSCQLPYIYFVYLFSSFISQKNISFTH